jgi:hypothetical protein
LTCEHVEEVLLECHSAVGKRLAHPP